MESLNLSERAANRLTEIKTELENLDNLNSKIDQTKKVLVELAMTNNMKIQVIAVRGVDCTSVDISPGLAYKLFKNMRDDYINQLSELSKRLDKILF